MTSTTLAAGAAAVFGLLLGAATLLPYAAASTGHNTRTNANSTCWNQSPGPAGQPAAVAVGGLDEEQDRNAGVIIVVTRDLGYPPRAAVIAVATALQESSLRNLGYGDDAGPDSRGLFQQRLRYYSDINPLDPAQATRAFLTRLVAVPGWDTIALTRAAQTVQRSAYPDAYTRWEPQAL